MPPSDSIQRIGTASAYDSTATRAVATTTGTAAAATSTGVTSTAESTATDAAAIHPNPAAVLDPASGLIVMEFRDAQDQVVSTVPSRQQIDAYENTQRGEPARQADARSTASIAAYSNGSATTPSDPADTAATAADPVSDGAGLVAAAQAALADTDTTGSVVQTSSTTGT